MVRVFSIALGCLAVLMISGCQNKFISYNKFSFLSIPVPAPIKKDVRVALVLGGGGARALAHVGVIEVLEKHKIPIDLIVGASAGSIIGAAYADNPNSVRLKDKFINLKSLDFLDFSLVSLIRSTYSLTGSIDGRTAEAFTSKNINAGLFEDLKIPFIAVATDIKTGNTVGLRSGPVAPAVKASYSIPGLFSPVQLYGMTLVDGGVSAPVPVIVAKQYNPKVIIAVDISTPVENHNLKNLFDVVYQSLSITYYHLNDSLGKQADILIKPDVQDIGIFDDGRNYELYEAGKSAAEAQINNILKLIKRKEGIIGKIFSAQTLESNPRIN